MGIIGCIASKWRAAVPTISATFIEWSSWNLQGIYKIMKSIFEQNGLGNFSSLKMAVTIINSIFPALHTRKCDGIV